MAIERFSRAQFEAALPTHKINGLPLWRSLGMSRGEHIYALDVKAGVIVYIRSSVRADGQCADTGEDSIRCWIASDDGGTPLAGKTQKYITRVSGWDKRLRDVLRKLWVLGRALPECEKCGKVAHACKTKDGENAGKLYAKCFPCKNWIKFLEVA